MADRETQNQYMQAAEEIRQAAIAQREEELCEVLAMTPEALTQHLENELASTDVLLDGFSMATQISEGTSFVLHGLLRTRAALESAVAWIQAKNPEQDAVPVSKKTNSVLDITGDL